MVSAALGAFALLHPQRSYAHDSRSTRALTRLWPNANSRVWTSASIT